MSYQRRPPIRSRRIGIAMASLVALLLTVAVAKGPLPAADAQTTETTTTIAPPPTSSSIPPIAQPDTAAWLGDSFSAGEGVPPFLAGTDTLTNRCHRSTRAHGMRLTGKPGFPSKSVFAACSFAFIANFYTGQGQWGEKGQLENLTAQHRLVALTVGGNDIGFVGWMALCIGSANCQLNDPLVRVLIANTQPRLAKLYGTS